MYEDVFWVESENEAALNEEWDVVKEKISDSMRPLSYKIWIKPLRLIRTEGDCLVFRYQAIMPQDELKEMDFYIRLKYEKVILDCYNTYMMTEYKRIKIQ